MNVINLHGLGVALITPFQSNGEIDEAALSQLIDNQLDSKVDYLVALGTTAETPTLSLDEQQRIARLVVERVNGRVPVVLGVGGNNTRAIVHRLQTEDFTGIDAILSVVPYYNKPNQEGIYQHYKQLSAASPRPLILYNVPGRTGANCSADTTLRLARECENIIAVKEASGNITQITQILQNKPETFQLLSGDDALALPLIAMGAAGVISVMGNAFPAEFRRLTHAALQGDLPTAQSLNRRFAELCELLFVDGNPAGIKALLHLQGKIENVLRLPLTPASAATMERMQNCINID
jgi:4-hydroxy-tetrahydrodipicolinate synthase